MHLLMHIFPSNGEATFFLRWAECKTLHLKDLLALCRMQELQSSSGLANVSKKLQEFLMSDTFDEQEYDRAMQESFNEAYYQVGTPFYQSCLAMPSSIPVAWQQMIRMS